MYQLTPNDFKIVKTPKGDLVQLLRDELLVVLFYKNEENRVYSDEFIKVFEQIEQTEVECKFAVINVDEYPECVDLSSKTFTPIHYVPYVVVYVHGRPYMSYSGKIDAVELVKLITYVQLMETVTAQIQIDKKTVVPIYFVKEDEQPKEDDKE